MITAIIVSRGLSGLLTHCILALNRALESCESERTHELFVVDNASESPYQAADFSGSNARLLRFDLPQNFAKANNTAAIQATGDYLLLLNNDVLLHDKALKTMSDFLDSNAAAGICGTRLLFPDGSVQHCGILFGAGKKGPYHEYRKQPNHCAPRATVKRQAVTGACMMVRRSLWQEMSGLDESYPFGLEDVDLCLRAGRQGAGIYCCNETDSLHFESMTPGRVKLDIPSRHLFMERWKGRYKVDG